MDLAEQWFPRGRQTEFAMDFLWLGEWLDE